MLKIAPLNHLLFVVKIRRDFRQGHNSSLVLSRLDETRRETDALSRLV